MTDLGAYLLEQQLIGGILRRPDTLHQASAAGLTTNDLTDNMTSRAFSAILSLDLDRSPITPATVANVVHLPAEALEHWFDEGDPGAVVYLAREIRKASARRRLSQKLRELVAMAETCDPEQVLAEAEALAEIEVESSGTQPVADFVDAALDGMDPKKRASQFYTTGLPGLDKALGGGISMYDEQLVIGADTGAGKTTAALNMARHIAHTAGITPLFFSLEMTGVSVAQKLIGDVSGIPIRKAHYSAHEWAHLRAAADWVRSLPLRLATVAPTAKSIGAEIRAHVRAQGQTPIFVDYMQLMKSDERNSVDRIAEVSMELRRSGRNLGVPIIALAQLNREGSKTRKQPSMHDFYGSGQIEKDCTAALLMWRPDPETNEVFAVLDKRRFTPVESYRRPDGSEGERIVSPKLAWEWHRSGQRFKEVGADDDHR